MSLSSCGVLSRLLAVTVLVSFLCRAQSALISSQASALLDLAIAVPNLQRLSFPWRPSNASSACSWTGVECDAAGTNVIGISISNTCLEVREIHQRESTIVLSATISSWSSNVTQTNRLTFLSRPLLMIEFCDATPFSFRERFLLRYSTSES